MCTLPSREISVDAAIAPGLGHLQRISLAIVDSPADSHGNPVVRRGPWQQCRACACRINEYGCEGGNIDYAYEWIIQNGGIATEEEYSYRAVDEECDMSLRDTYKVRRGRGV